MDPNDVITSLMEPVQVESSLRFTSVGGLKEHIKCLREMIIFPLMYPELFEKFNTRPAKGVLFYGPPGTGKTLLARALANECSSVDGRKVSFFMRKGCDIMNKYYGESEKNLKVLFNTARKLKPSIIFFDEIDALAPLRQNDNDNHVASIVATLLAEMDGVSDRGNVIVIGATNRPEAMDPAIRRAGRFDRELYFPPPDFETRKEILHIYTKDWEPQPSGVILDEMAEKTVGFLGSDIKAMCSEAVLKAVRRVYPQIYESNFKLLINEQNVAVTQGDLISAMDEIVPTGIRYAPSSAKPLPPHTLPLLQAQVQVASVLLNKAFPPPTDKKFDSKNESSTAPSVFMVSGECSETLIAPALLAQLEHCYIKELSVPTLYGAEFDTPEQVVISLFSKSHHQSNTPCVIFIRDLLAVWTALDGKGGSEVLLQMWRRSTVGENILLLAAWDGELKQLPAKLQELFPVYKDCIYEVRKPTPREVMEFLTPVVTELPLMPPMVYTYAPPPPLPRAPTEPKEDTEDAVRRMFHEYENQRILRSQLKSICTYLSTDTRFKKFASEFPVGKEENHYEVIKQPMDLSKIFNKIVDKRYYCAKEFLDDIDLICSNAVLYQKMYPGKKILGDALRLHSTAHDMVADEIDPQLELECQIIAKKKREGDDFSDCGSFCEDFYTDNSDSGQIEGYEAYEFSKHPRCCHKRRKHNTRGPIAKRRKHDYPSDKRKHNVKDVKNDKKENHRNEPEKPEDTKDAGKKKKDKSRPNQSIYIADEDIPNSPEILEVIINKPDLEEIVKKYSDPLSALSLETLIDLHTQLSKTVYTYSLALDRTKLPKDMDATISKYIEHARVGNDSSSGESRSSKN